MPNCDMRAVTVKQQAMPGELASNKAGSDLRSYL